MEPTKELESEADRRRKLTKRAIGLVARAAHEGTPEEEARSSALIAAKVIHAEKLLEPAPRHPLLDRLEGLDDATLDELAMNVENLLAGAANRPGSTWDRIVHHEVQLWRARAESSQRRLSAFAGALRRILQSYKMGLVERPSYCIICRRPIMLGDLSVWKRRRQEAAHYTCCVIELQRQGAVPL